MVLDEIEQGSHIVHFYADDFELAASIARYAADGLDAGEALVVIAKPAHIASVRDALVAIDVDPDASNVHMFDAAATLRQFMEDGLADRDRFAEVVGGTLRAAGEGRTGVRAYGEMVEILWERGDVTGALALEGLWNDLAREVSFSLYCAYQENVVARGVEVALDEACRLHSAVVADGTHRSRQSASAHFDASDDAPAEARAFVLGELRDERTPSSPAVRR